MDYFCRVAQKGSCNVKNHKVKIKMLSQQLKRNAGRIVRKNLTYTKPHLPMKTNNEHVSNKAAEKNKSTEKRIRLSVKLNI